MEDSILVGMLLASLLAAAALYWLRVGEQVHARRLDERMNEIRHVTAVLRATLSRDRQPT